MRRCISFLAPVLVLSFLSIACTGYYYSVQNVRKGILVSNTDRRAFVDVWGPPDRTYLKKGKDILIHWSPVWGPATGVFIDNRTYDVWEYQKRGVTLYFDGYYLVDWTTNKTTKELSTQ